MSRNLTIGLAGMAVLAVAAFVMFNPFKNDAASTSFATEESIIQTTDTPAVNTDSAVMVSDTNAVIDMTQGADDAPVTLIEYASFTCPHCKTFHTNVYPELKKNYIDTGKVKFIFREVYFDRLGLWAGMMARCGGESKYFGITDLLFKRQSEWTSGDGGAEIAQNLYKIGRLAGMSDSQMEACLQDQDKAKAMVAAFQKNAEADGINSTPSLIINGVNHSNISYIELSRLLDEAAEK